jgi:predicted membrane protein (TIGR00267 family)
MVSARTLDDEHIEGRWISDLVLGAQDGLVNTLGIVLGVAAASGSGRITLASGLAASVAEALSMAAVGYTSSLARGELYRSERAREYRHVESTPAAEREEIRVLFAAKGFEGELLDRVVDTICANKDVWVAVMMADEHHLVEVDHRASLRSTAVIGLASLGGALIPVAPFAVFSGTLASVVSLAASALGLFALGAYKAKVTTGRRARSGVVLAAIGLASALVGYVVGTAFGVSP